MPLLPNNARSLYAALVIAAIMVAALVLGREVLVPIAVGALVAFMLSPIVIWLAARRIPRALSAVGLLLGFLLLVLSLSAVLSSQLLTLADEFVEHQQNAIDKIRVFAGAARGDGVIKRVS
jgi:predicted PurR-regulated permease PerM